jgi:hypothetical protein
MTMWLDLKRHFEARAVEWCSAFILAAWGADLILHPGLFTGITAPVWQAHLVLADQEVWGFGAFTAGGIRVVALFINGRWGLTPLIRVATSFLSVFVWFWVAVGLFLAGFANTGVVVYTGLMLADMYSAFRAASDAYEAEAMKRLQELSEQGPGNVASIRGR